MLLLALAVLARVLVPSGWMPAEHGGLAFVPCPAAGPVTTMPMHHGGAQDGPVHGSKAASDCAFAPLLAAGALSPRVALPDAPAAVTAPSPAAALSPLRPSAAHGLPPATGPPALT